MRLFSMVLLLAVPVAGVAQGVPETTVPIVAVADDPLNARAADLVAVLNGGGDLAAIFAPAFLAQVPAAQVRAISGQVIGGIGRAVRVAKVEVIGPGRANVTIAGQRGTVTLRLVVGAAAPNLIDGLLITGSATAETTLSEVAAALKALPGTTGFALADLGDQPTIVLGYEAERALAIGSTFKLVILAELVRETAGGTRHWDDLVTLDGRELPAGGYNRKPAGTQVTLRELAEQMISVSDNSATDLLLTTLGRERVEAMQKMLGIAAPAANRPFLTTLEAFKLKGIAALREPWLAGDERARRKLLEGVDAADTAPLATLFADGKPVAPDRIEWFASPADLVRTMDWLRRHTESGPGAEGRRILAINPGIAQPDAARFGYVGFKGGSEPGVISMTLLLRDRAGGWHVLSAGWNDAAAPVDDARFVALMSRAAELIAGP